MPDPSPITYQPGEEVTLPLPQYLDATLAEPMLSLPDNELHFPLDLGPEVTFTVPINQVLLDAETMHLSRRGWMHKWADRHAAMTLDAIDKIAELEKQMHQEREAVYLGFVLRFGDKDAKKHLPRFSSAEIEGLMRLIMETARGLTLREKKGSTGLSGDTSSSAKTSTVDALDAPAHNGTSTMAPKTPSTSSH